MKYKADDLSNPLVWGRIKEAINTKGGYATVPEIRDHLRSYYGPLYDTARVNAILHGKFSLFFQAGTDIRDFTSNIYEIQRGPVRGRRMCKLWTYNAEAFSEL